MVIKTPLKVLIVVAVLGTFAGGFHLAQKHGLIPVPGFMAALIPEKAELPKVKDGDVTTVAQVAAPSTSEASLSSTLIRGEFWEWNAQMGLIYATGGACTTKGSLMEKHEVNLCLARQDDTNKMQDDLISCAKEIAGGAKQCSTGANFVVIMGDGAGQFAAQINPQLKKLGGQWGVEVIGAAGYSRGEDAFMAPPNVKIEGGAVNAKGLLVEGVLRDGDWNIAMKWAADNGIKNNPDEHTWDPDALNWVNAPDYNTAATDYAAVDSKGNPTKCEDRKVVKDGRPTGETVHKCVNAVVTWTPGDVTVVHSARGGLVKIVSSKEYRSQMPAVIIGPKKFFDDNQKEFYGLLAATFEAGDQIKSFDSALKKGAEISASIYKDKDADAAYWYKYFKGAVETDSQGNPVLLGGSAVNNLADNLILFGLSPGSNDNFRSTYLTFARIDMQQYPALYKDTPIPDVKEVEDRSFVTGAQASMTTSGDAADEPTFTVADDAKATHVVSKRSYNITFDTGKATLTKEGIKQLYELKDDHALDALYIDVDGYTDNTGNEQATNLPLSRARAQAVKAFLQRVAQNNFPDKRIHTSGHGSSDPVQSNNTGAGRAANRRVQITTRG